MLSFFLLLEKYVFPKERPLFWRNGIPVDFPHNSKYDFATATLPDQMERLILQRCFFRKKDMSLHEQLKIMPFGATAEKSATWKLWIYIFF